MRPVAWAVVASTAIAALAFLLGKQMEYTHKRFILSKGFTDMILEQVNEQTNGHVSLMSPNGDSGHYL